MAARLQVDHAPVTGFTTSSSSGHPIGQLVLVVGAGGDELPRQIPARQPGYDTSVMRPPIRLLGPLEVDAADRGGDLGPPRQRAVLAVLLLADGHAVHSDDLVLRVWGDDPPPGARQALRAYISRLRQAVAGVPGLHLERANGGYVAAAGPEHLDLSVFRRLVTDARAARLGGDLDGARHGLAQALRLWPGGALADVHSAWLEDVRTALTEERLGVDTEYHELALQSGEHDRVLPGLMARVADEPYDERWAAQLMLALQASGRASESLKVYDRTRRRLRDELGTEPGRHLRETHQRILRADAGPSSRPVAEPATRLVPRQLPPALVGFVDRRTEQQDLDPALVGKPGEAPLRLAIVTGTGGVGKTSLAVRWAREHATQFPDGQLFVDLQGFDPNHPPLTAESALHGFLLALGADPAALPVDLGGLTGLYRTMLHGKRVLVVADNARTSGQVRPLLPPGPGAVALVTSRSGLPGILADHAAQVINVGMLDPGDARTLISNRLGLRRVAQESASVDRLVAHCAGLPLALAIVAGRAALAPHLPLAALAEELHDESRRIDGLCSGEPGSDVRVTLDASVAALPGSAGGVLGLMGLVPGPSVSFRGFTALTGLSDPSATAMLRDLTGSHLVEQEPPGRYRMHDLVRLYASGLGRHHPAAAESIRRLLQHYLTGVLGGSPAVPTGGAAEDFVSTELLSLTAAVDLAVTEGLDLLACDLTTALQSHLGARGCWRELVRLSSTAAAAAIRLGDDTRLVHAELGLGRGGIGMRQFDLAAAHLGRAHQLAQDLPGPGPLAQVHRALARLAAHQNQHQSALHHDEYALELHRQSGDRCGQATAYNAIGWHQAHLGEPEPALRNCQRALDIFDATGDRTGQALTLDSLGFALDLLGRHVEAQDYYRRSASLSADLGAHITRAATLRRLAQSYRRSGHAGAAMQVEQEEVEVLKLTGWATR